MPSLQMDHDFQRRKGHRHAIQGLFFIFVFVLAAFFFLQSSFFAVRNIKVLGNKHLNESEITDLAGVSPGVNIFRADLKAARERIALHPLVKEVQTGRDYPATVVIRVTEREPVGLAWGQDGFAVISEDGHILEKVDNLGQVNYPIISGVELGTTGAGQPVADERIGAALRYLGAMPPNVKAAISEINVADLNDIRVFTVDKAEVKFGDADRIEEKIRLYQEVISQKYDQPIQYIDVSFKGNPVIKFVEPAEPKQTGEKKG